MKSPSLFIAIISLVSCLSVEARFASKPFQNVSGSTPAPSAPASSRPSRESQAPASNYGEAKAPPKYDKRVKAALDARSMKYRIEDNGSFILSIEWETGEEDKRSQIVCIRSVTEELAGLEMREVWSKGFGGSRLSRNELANVLVQNEGFKVGAWGMQRSSDGKEHLFFTAKVPADLSAKALIGIVVAVAKTADALELKLDGGDDL